MPAANIAPVDRPTIEQKMTMFILGGMIGPRPAAVDRHTTE